MNIQISKNEVNLLMDHNYPIEGVTQGGVHWCVRGWSLLGLGPKMKIDIVSAHELLRACNISKSRLVFFRKEKY